MSALIAVALAAALWLTIGPGQRQSGRIRSVLVRTGGECHRPGWVGPLLEVFKRSLRLGRPGPGPVAFPMTLVVQQLAALLRGGRTPARLWDELSALYPAGGQLAPGESSGRSSNHGGGADGPDSSFRLVLAAARAASLRGAAVSDAIRSATVAVPDAKSRERRTWGELAACFDIAEASGCPLADVLTRFAAQLEAEDDAEAARQTALAGPRATVRLLTWLPFLGLLLGAALGVDPLSILLGSPHGLAALGAGIVLTIAGRVWSAKLVRLAAETP